MTHAMVISGVHLDLEDKPVRYKVENSWGETAGKEGYFIMTDEWFNEYVYATLTRLTNTERRFLLLQIRLPSGRS